jgi:hypothetical protein
VSCLNTSLVVLMLARRRDKLAFCLNALREEEYAGKYPGRLLNNLHNLLCFWQCHYLNKDKDSTCLENVSVLDNAHTHTPLLLLMLSTLYCLLWWYFCIGSPVHWTIFSILFGVQGNLCHCCISPILYQSSCISCTYWKETVSVLLDSDLTSLCANSLLHPGLHGSGQRLSGSLMLLDGWIEKRGESISTFSYKLNRSELSLLHILRSTE